jgi:S-disulfanyl-L-cysteine oxidoreductase SoxD
LAIRHDSCRLHQAGDAAAYALTAFILAEANIIDQSQVMDASTLPEVEMPNRTGFIPDPRPDVHNYD